MRRSKRSRSYNDYSNYQNQNYCNYYFDETDLYYGRAMLDEISQYFGDCTDKLKKAAKYYQTQMLKEIKEQSPVKKGGTVNRIIVHRSAQVPHAVRVVAGKEKQPGYFKQGWKRITWDHGDDIFGVGVRNKNMPMVVHLLNFDHDIVAHGWRKRNAYKGTGFISDIQRKYQDELSDKIEEILDGDE